MSILSDIQANTLSVRSGKNSIEQAIIDKGGTVEKEETLATFNELITGIGSIQTSAGLNIFLQNTEPETKNGLWLKTTKTYDNIVTDTDVSTTPYWNNTKMGQIQAIPSNLQTDTKGVVASVGNYVYIFNGGNNYKYNPATDTYTNINFPTTVTPKLRASAVHGTDIYIGANGYIYIYHTANDTYESVSITQQFGTGSATFITLGDYIYIYNGLNPAGNAWFFYRFDINAKTVSVVSGTSSTNYSDVWNGVSVGTDIYLFQNSKIKKFDTTNLTFTILTTSATYSFGAEYGSTCIAVGTDIYLFGGILNKTACYKYDTLTGTETQMESSTVGTGGACPVLVGTDIYLFGAYNNTYGSVTKVNIFSFPTKTYANNSVIIVTNSSSQLETILIDTDVENGIPFYFDDVLFYDTTNGLYTNMQRYYGDGTQWNLIQ